MSYKKIIFGNGKILVEVEDGKSKTSVTEEFDDNLDEFVRLYDCEVEFLQDLTVGGFLRALYPFLPIIEYHFSAFTGNYTLNQYFDLLEIEAKPSHNELEQKIDYIEMYWACEINDSYDIVKNVIDSNFTMYGSYHGKSKLEKINYSMSLTPLNNWQHYNFKLNKNLDCWKISEDKNGKINHEQIFSSNRDWNLHDLLKWFFYELTFMGSIEETKNFADELYKKEEKIDIGIGGFEKIDMNQWQINYYEEMLCDEIANENYEAAARIKEKIEKLKEEQSKQ